MRVDAGWFTAHHPDAPDFGFGGTVAKLASAGVEVTYVICSDGSQGSADPTVPDAELTRIRYQEQRDAATVLGVRNVVFLGFPDGRLRDTAELRVAIAREIRRFRPDAVFTHSPVRNLAVPIGNAHPDHLAVGQATFAAVCAGACNWRAHRELLREGLEPHAVSEIWIGTWMEGDYAIDLSDFVERKVKALRCHRSQFEQPGVAPFDVETFIRERMADAGRKAGYQYAAAFRRIPAGRCYAYIAPGFAPDST